MKKQMLMVVDYQNDFVNGALGFVGADALDQRIAKKIREYGEGNVIYLVDTHDENYLNTREGKILPIKHCIKNSDGWEVYGETKQALNEVQATRYTKNTFGINPELLKPYKNIDTLEIAGLVTNMCVLSNVCIFQAVSPETQIIVDSQLCGSFDQELHKKALDVLRGLHVQVL